MVAQMIVAVTHEIGNLFILTKPVFHSILSTKQCWLVISTLLKHISQNWNLPQIGVKKKNIWNYHPEFHPIQSHTHRTSRIFLAPRTPAQPMRLERQTPGKTTCVKGRRRLLAGGCHEEFSNVYKKNEYTKNRTFLYKNIPGACLSK